MNSIIYRSGLHTATLARLHGGLRGVDDLEFRLRAVVSHAWQN